MNRLTARGRAEHRELLADTAEVEHLVERWRRVCEGAELIHRIDTVTGPTITTPQIVDLTLGPPTVLVVRLLPGQLRTDFLAIGRRLAEGMGAAAVRVEQRGHHFVVVTLLVRDPLDGIVAPFRATRSGVASPPILGVSETGDVVSLDLAAGAHVIGQGSSGSGKSMALYGLLAQLRDAVDVRVTGSDPTGLLLGPWARNRAPQDRWEVPTPALGTSDPTAHVIVLEELVELMDDRIRAMPAGRDSVDLTDPATPLVLAVLEEYAGLLRLLDQVDKKQGANARALVARVAAEGRKAGIRLWILVQRADAAIVDGYTRAQATHRISWRVDSTEALRMLHADATADTVIDHSTALPGVGLITAPGTPLTRFRAPYLDYASYVAAITRGNEADQ